MARGCLILLSDFEKDVSGIVDRCSQLKKKYIKKNLKLHERFLSDSELRTEQIIFEIDSEDQWDTAIAKVITKER